MKRLLFLLSLFAIITSCSDEKKRAIPIDSTIEQQVEELLAKMTLDEKIGQMMQLAIDVVGKSGDISQGFQVDTVKLKEVIGKYKVGSLLNAPFAGALTPEQWQEVIGTIQQFSMREIGIPCLYGLDQNHGSTYSKGGTFFPQNIGMGATFNPELVRQGAEITAYEARASNVPWTFSPTIDLGRDQRWPRLWENYGEDVYVNAAMAVAAVRGFQGDDPNHVDSTHIAVTLKHFLGYGIPFTGKDRTPAYISPSDLREKYFEPYRAAIQAGALSLMVNSGSVNGVPVHSNHELLTTWLKEELNWDGMIITDWADIDNLHNRERVAKDKKDAIRIAINAGIDMTMDPYDVNFCTLLRELVDEGLVAQSRIDDAVRRILRLKLRLGLMNKNMYQATDYQLFGSEQFDSVALSAARESMVLLKNTNNILPLRPGLKILVSGPNANSMRCLNGGWTYTWQGNNVEELLAEHNTIYEALAARFGSANITLCQGVTYNESGQYYDELEPEIDKAVSAAQSVDVIVACVGENSYTETPGNLTDLTLSTNQRELVKALARTGKPIILILNEGRPRLVADIEPLASAVVNILLPGNMGGDALAELLSGEANFSGKLPYTYPREINSLHTYDYRMSEEVGTMSGAYNYDARISQQWPFGFGLSYTTFAYSNLRVDKSSFAPGDCLQVSVDVSNTGNRVGKETVLLYSSDLVSLLTPENRRLRRFDKIELQPGETKTVSFELPAEDLAYVGSDGRWRLDEGEFRITIGGQASTIICTKTKIWDSPNR